MASDRYGIVYMGSKEKVLHLIRYIFEREYKKKNMIDLFCGGLSVTNYAVQKTHFNVIANDLNKYVIALFKEIIQNKGVRLDDFKYDWVSRETFDDVRDNPEMFEDWAVGYILNVWSFGCNQKDYLYAKDLEQNKKAVHQALVHNDFSMMESNELFSGFKISQTIKELRYREHPLKRLAFMAAFKSFIRSNTGTERLQHLERLEQIENVSQMEHLSAVKRAGKHIDRIKLWNMDWKAAYDSIPESILSDCFIYCDPPYEETKQYQFGMDFNYNEFWEWFRGCPYPVYVSSYTAPGDIKPINFDLKIQLMDNGSRSGGRFAEKKRAIENIYWNGKGNPEPTMEDILFKEEEE